MPLVDVVKMFVLLPSSFSKAPKLYLILFQKQCPHGLCWFHGYVQ